MDPILDEAPVKFDLTELPVAEAPVPVQVIVVDDQPKPQPADAPEDV